MTSPDLQRDYPHTSLLKGGFENYMAFIGNLTVLRVPRPDINPTQRLKDQSKAKSRGLHIRRRDQGPQAKLITPPPLVKRTPDTRRQPRPSTPRSKPDPSRVAPEQFQPSPEASGQGLMHPTLRANPFPEVMDLFCRLPLSTLFYQLEAVHLGDLLRL